MTYWSQWNGDKQQLSTHNDNSSVIRDSLISGAHAKRHSVAAVKALMLRDRAPNSVDCYK